MKTPEEVLKQVVLGEIYCFRCKKNHPTDVFNTCIKSFAIETIGIEACYWRLLRGRLKKEEFRGIKASYYINPEPITGALLNRAYDLHLYLKEVTKPFFNIRNMARFSSVSEAVRCISKDDVRKFRLPIDTVRGLREYYAELTEAQVVDINVKFPSVTLSVRYRQYNSDYCAYRSNIIKYLQTLTGYSSIDCFVVFVPGKEQHLAKFGKEDHKCKSVKLTSPVTCVMVN